MKETFITQSEDLDITYTLLDSNGNPVPLNLVTKMYVVIHDGYNAPVAKFSKTGLPSTGWYPIDLSQAASGIFTVKVLTVITNLLAEGRYYMEIKLRYTDVNYLDDSFNDIMESRLYVFSVRKSIIQALPSVP